MSVFRSIFHKKKKVLAWLKGIEMAFENKLPNFLIALEVSSRMIVYILNQEQVY